MSVTSAELLKNLLRPLGIYDVDDGYGALELEALGSEMDKLYEHLISAEKGIFSQTADDTALETFEYLLPYSPHSTNLRERREAVSALLQADGFGFSVDELNRILSGCGICAQVREGEEKYHVTVRFPDRRGQPASFEDMAEISERIEAILPCHLAIDYEISFFNWRQLERTYLTWQQLEDECESWYELELTSE